MVEARQRAIVAVRLSALGDVIHTMPAIVALRNAHPEASIGWIVEAPYRELVELVAPVDRVFVARTKRWRKQPVAAETRDEIFAIRRELREFVHGDTTIDFQGLAKSSLFARLSGAKRRYGFARSALREGAAALFTNRKVAVDETRHVIEWNMQLAAALGASLDVPPVDYSRFLLASDAVERFGTSHPIVLNPGAGKERKEWGVAKFAELARRIRETMKREVVVTWGPGEREKADAIAKEGGAILAPQTSLRELAYVLAHAALVVAGDTGPLHLAVAAGARVVGLYGPTDPRRNGPYRQIDRCVETFSGSRTMEAISVDAVLRRIEESIE